MITSLPRAEDFYQSGKELLDFAWDIVSTLLRDIDEAIEHFDVDTDEVTEEYWIAAKSRLSTALAITQQGTEFILKGKIVSISPYLLIADSPSKWPSPYTANEINFSKFRTIDAQDLIRVLDTFSVQSLPQDFVVKFHSLREKRNTIIHSINKQLVVEVKEVIESILFIHKSLFPNENWASIRLKFLSNTPESGLDANEYSTNIVCWEVSLIMKLLTPSEIRKYFGIATKQRKYICPKCYYNANTDAGFDYKFATLQPKGPKSTSLFCPVCNENHVVIRQQCEYCPGNVLSNEEECLTCCG